MNELLNSLLHNTVLFCCSQPIYLNLQLRHKASAASGNNDGRQDRTSDKTYSFTNRHAPMRKVISINGEEVDAESANIHDFTTFEKEELIGSAFMDGIKRKSPGAGDGAVSLPKRMVSFRNTVKTIIHSEAVMKALKHYSHRSDSDETDDEVECVVPLKQATDSRDTASISNNDSAFNSSLTSPSSDDATVGMIGSCSDEMMCPVTMLATDEVLVTREIVVSDLLTDPEVDNAMNCEQSLSTAQQTPTVDENKSSQTTVLTESQGVDSETSVSIETTYVDQDKSHSEVSVSVESTKIDDCRAQFELSAIVEPSSLDQNSSQSEMLVEQSCVQHEEHEKKDTLPSEPKGNLLCENQQILTDSDVKAISTEFTICGNSKDEPDVPLSTSPRIASPLPISDLPSPKKQSLDSTFNSSLATTKPPASDVHDRRPLCNNEQLESAPVPSCETVSSMQGVVNGSIGNLDITSRRPDTEDIDNLTKGNETDHLLASKAPNDCAAAVVDSELDRLSTDDDDKTDMPTDSLLPSSANDAHKSQNASSDGECRCCYCQ